ncbi:MAG TPA: peptide chain release factor N(5)-glutamine methyltransferase [Phycisphaerales bacterium]|nr:peptide chain release factor N(5)-glutamine methyltransferase [Phycisphaerales bacterium]
MTQTHANQWTTRSLLEWMTTRFEENAIDSPRLISEMLLSHVLGGQRIDLYANADRQATDNERDTLRLLVKRTLEHEPVQYIVGKAWFNGLEFSVNSSTLIPRSCTETIVDQCLLYCKSTATDTPIRIADIGTGSGCIAVSIAKNTTSCTIYATDISNEALTVAKENAHTHGVEDDITFVQGDGLAPLLDLEPFDFIGSNPPYIPDHEMNELAPNVKDWESELALSGGKTGLRVITPILEHAPNCLKSGGILLIEISTSTKNLVLELAQRNAELCDQIILRDCFGDDRFLKATKR